MLSHSFTISEERRRSQEQPEEFRVSGRCAPDDPFSTRWEALRFISQEIAKYQNGAVTPFVGTHVILWWPPQSPVVRRRIAVRMVETREQRETPIALFTEDEWSACVLPQWGYDVSQDRLTLEDILMGRSWSLVTWEAGWENLAAGSDGNKLLHARL